MFKKIKKEISWWKEKADDTTKLVYKILFSIGAIALLCIVFCIAGDSDNDDYDDDFYYRDYDYEDYVNDGDNAVDNVDDNAEKKKKDRVKFSKENDLNVLMIIKNRFATIQYNKYDDDVNDIDCRDGYKVIRATITIENHSDYDFNIFDSDFECIIDNRKMKKLNVNYNYDNLCFYDYFKLEKNNKKTFNIYFEIPYDINECQIRLHNPIYISEEDIYFNIG